MGLLRPTFEVTWVYIDLLKRILINTIYEDPGYAEKRYDAQLRSTGRDWPISAHTMVGLKRLDNLHYCLKTVLENHIPGDCIETGVWRGGCTILMRGILKAYQDTERKVWVADSFVGFPVPNLERYPIDAMWSNPEFSFLSVSMEEVMNNFRKYDLLDSQVIFVKGFFSETLPKISIDRIALLRLDGDLYESTMDALTYLYPKLSKNGFIIVDDWSLESCQSAVKDYRKKFYIEDPIIEIDGAGAYWIKSTD